MVWCNCFLKLQINAGILETEACGRPRAAPSLSLYRPIFSTILMTAKLA